MYSHIHLLYSFYLGSQDREPFLETLDIRREYMLDGMSHEAPTPQMLHTFLALSFRILKLIKSGTLESVKRHRYHHTDVNRR